ncbi:hypothetical protein [Acinetobacter sp. HR7]|uniref:hypothetical protein n=1 Tax=Acinetobacter sp. HR7 TaxID=1509403 RepID=UPI0005378C94|nr:hypothetical protein [Acinetobacter sp. HR7]KGT48411.1 hypothetical protein GW12_05620 [Acinetobacter sp. HR7]
MTLEELRLKFKKLPHIELIIHLFAYNVDLNKYEPISDFVVPEYIGFINGAWYAFQEQQKKIDDFLNAVKGSVLVESCKCKPEKVCLE